VGSYVVRNPATEVFLPAMSIRSGIDNKLLRLHIANFSGFGICRVQHSPRVIVSLTTWPGRLLDVSGPIYSLMTQSWKPDRIVLYMSSIEFRNTRVRLTNELVNLMRFGLEIRWVDEDLRVYLKLLPALREFPDDVIITADDDMFYQNTRVERLVASWMRGGDFVHAHRARVVPFNHSVDVRIHFMEWQFAFQKDFPTPSLLLFPEGVGNVLYPPRKFTWKIFDRNTCMRLAPTSDDHWYWAMQVVSGIKTKIVEHNDPYVMYAPARRHTRNLITINYRGAYERQTKALVDELNLSTFLREGQ
jgi:hypothetical protein